MNEAAFETAADVARRNLVSALLHELPHAGDGLRGAGKPEAGSMKNLTMFAAIFLDLGTVARTGRIRLS